MGKSEGGGYSREVPQFEVRAYGLIGDVEIMDYPTSPR
jgi:hypothetical protein